MVGRNDHMRRQIDQRFGMDVVRQSQTVGERKFDPAGLQHADQFLLIAFMQCHRDAGMTLREPGQQARHEADRKRQKAADRDVAFERVAEVHRVLGEVLGVLQKQPGLVDHPLPDRGEGHAAGMLADE